MAEQADRRTDIEIEAGITLSAPIPEPKKEDICILCLEPIGDDERESWLDASMDILSDEFDFVGWSHRSCAMFTSDHKVTEAFARLGRRPDH